MNCLSTKSVCMATPISNCLGYDELATIVHLLMSSQSSCEDITGFLAVFARPGVWRYIALSMNYENVHTKQQFCSMCCLERQRRMASHYKRPQTLADILIERDSSAKWIKSNLWVVPGLTVSDYSFDVEVHYLIKRKGKKKVILTNAPAKQGVAMYCSGPFGTKYAVQARGKQYMLVRPGYFVST